MNAVFGDLQFVRRVEDAAVFEKSEDTARCGDLRLGSLPGHPTEWS
jgi:hypothetical protein